MTPGEARVWLEAQSPERFHRELVNLLRWQESRAYITGKPMPLVHVGWYLHKIKYSLLPRSQEATAQANRQKVATLFSGIGNYK